MTITSLPDFRQHTFRSHILLQEFSVAYHVTVKNNRHITQSNVKKKLNLFINRTPHSF